MKRALTFITALMLCCAAVFPAAASAARTMPKPVLLAVYVYASWCPNCKILGPAIEEARAQGMLDKKDILFVRLDLSDKAAIHQSRLLAQALGLEEWLKTQGSATGYMALIDAETREEAARFDSGDDSAAILKNIAGRLPE